ncbi:MAG: metallophosphoesterase, partial [Oscillospiraceae bacterium]
MKKILSLVLCLGVLLCACSENKTAVPIPQSFDSSIAFAADTHYVATDDTKEKLSARQMPYSREIVQAMLYDCLKNGFDTLLLLGDLTNTGSESEHREIAQLLAQARDEGLDIYVVPGECDLLTIGEQG